MKLPSGSRPHAGWGPGLLLSLFAALTTGRAAAAADAPLLGSPFYFQTSGLATALTIGDWYTAAGGGAGYHYYAINIPCPGNTAFPIHVDLFSPELHGNDLGNATLDELRPTAAVASAGSTRFEVYGPATVVPPAPPYNVPGPGAAGSLLQTTYAPTTAAENWVRFYTLPTNSACGQYILRAETVGATADDDNSWRLRVSGDNDASALTAPVGAGLDPGITIGQIYGSMQHNGGGTQCISTYELLGAGNATFHNFDMDGGAGTVNYFPARNGGPIAGTISADSSWNVGTGSGPPPRDGDLVTVAANQTGYWRIETCLSNGNQFIQEGGTPFPGLFSLPLAMSLAKTDDVATAQMGGYLQYALTFTNTSVPTSGIAQSVVIVDTIPTNTTFDSAWVDAPATGTCSFASGAVTCSVNGTFSPGQGGTVIVNVLVDDPAAGTTVVNNASLDYRDLLDAEYPQQTATDTDQLPSLKLVKTSANPGDTGDGPQVGDVITYTLTLSNPSAVAQTSVVVNDPLPAGTTYLAQSTAATGFPITPAASKTFRDEFNTAGSYAGSNGATFWGPDWTEINEGDGAGGGDEIVAGGSLRVQDNDGGGEGVSRQADLLIAGGSGCAATLSFSRQRVGLDDANDFVTVAISPDGTPGSFTTLDTFAGGGSDVAFVSESYALATADVTATTVVRFLGSPNLGNNDRVLFDNVQLQNSCPAGTGTKDNIPGGVNADLLSGVPPTLVQAGDALSIPAAGSITVTFSVTVTAAGPIENTATATSTQDTDPAQGYVRDVALTRASLAGLRVGEGLVEFATSWQRGTAGFNLYSANARQRHAEKTRINGEFIRSPRPESMTPILYRVEAEAAAPYLWIEEVEVGSDSGRMMGPFATDDEAQRRQFDRLELRMSGQPGDERRESRSLRAPHKPRVRGPRVARRGPARAAATGVKIEVAEPGVIQLSWNDLLAEGMPPRFTRGPSRLQLTTRGTRVPFTTGPADLTFTARDLATDYSGDSVYVVTWAGVPVMAAPLTQSEPEAEGGFHRVQQNWIYYQAAPRGADPWLWDALASGDAWPASYDPTLGDFDLPGYAAGGGSIPVRIALLGRTEGHHHVEASINGAFVGSLDFSGVNVASLEGSIAASSLLPAGNHLTLTYSSPDGPDAWVYLNYLDLGLALPASPGVVGRVYAFDGELPRLNRADYLIVTHADFAAQADRIAAIKNAAGRSAVVVDVERAYDRFSAGIPDATAVKALIAEARRASTVLLIGDDTIDPADNYGLGARVFVPSAIGFDPFTGRVVSENLYADRNDDGAPDLAIGRLSVSTEAEAEAMVAKVANAESLLLQNLGRHVVAVDNQGINDMPFRGEGRRIEKMLDGSIAFADVSLGASAARDTLLEGLTAGALTTTWVGHGAPDHWADEGIFGSADAPAFANTNQGTLLLTWACVSSDYRYFYGPAVSEAMMLVPVGGAVASFGPTGLSLPTLQRELYMRLYPKLLAGMTLGEAVRETKTEMLATHPAEREFLHGWVLLGDPDVRLPR